MEFLRPKQEFLDVLKVGELRAIAKQEMTAANRVAFEKDNQPQNTIKFRRPNQYKTK